MDRAGELDLALDVDHAGLAGVDPGGDARGPAEGMIAEADHRQAVDLPDLGAVGIHHDGAVFVQLLHPLLDAVDPVELLLDGPQHIVVRDDGVPVLAGPRNWLRG